MYSEGQERAKIGKVQVDIYRGKYRLRFTYPQRRRHQIIISQVSSEGWTTAIKAAQLINRDIDLGDFDDTYARYSPKHAKSLEIAKQKTDKEYTLLELWENCKDTKRQTTAKTTQKSHWRLTTGALSKLSPDALIVNNPEKLIDELLSIYSKGTFVRIYADIYGAINLAVEQGKLDRNPHARLTRVIAKIKKESKQGIIEAFEPNEIKTIIGAFYSDEFCPQKSAYKHSYYASYVEFLALTGCRPEEAIALTWDDIKEQSNGTFIRFNKAFSKGVLLPCTKTKEIRLFRCNKQMEDFVTKHPRVDNPNNLIFPSVELKHIDHQNFRSRYWATVVKGLVKQGKIRKYLKPYCLRHSFITRM
ncbi:MAG: tyrosine-type recombinase/integrase, partial [Xenococcaceae cyanobacterium]